MIRLAKKHKIDYLELKDGYFRVCGGEVNNSLGADPALFRAALPELKKLNLNTVIVPVSWELIESEEGSFDFSIPHELIDACESIGLKLIFLWFGTWKNATSSYVPGWVKADLDRFPRMEFKSGSRSNAISCFSDEACEADSAAFANFTKWLKKTDSEKQTVIMLQVENESGTLATVRDYCPKAEKAFNEDVPLSLVEDLKSSGDDLEFSFKLESSVKNWGNIFENDAAEAFMAWNLAKYIDKVAEAGKKEYDIPMFVNAWISQPTKSKPGQYPSGGPVAKVLPIWKSATKNFSCFAPDIYMKDFRGACSSFSKSWNPLLIPEAQWDNRSASQALYAFGKHSALCFSPFACNQIKSPHPLMDSYKFIAEFDKMNIKQDFFIATAGFYQQDDDEISILSIKKIFINIKCTEIKDVPGGAFIAALSETDFIVAGWNAELEFALTDEGVSDIEFLCLDEGYIQGGEWISERRLNGDESYHGKTVRLGESFTCCKLSLNMNSAPIKHQTSWEFD